jgi:hypothetical protein
MAIPKHWRKEMNKNNVPPQLTKLRAMMWVTPIRGFRYKGFWFTRNRKMLVVDTLGGLITIALQRPLRNDQGNIDKSLLFPADGRKHCMLMNPAMILEHCREVDLDAT